MQWWCVAQPGAAWSWTWRPLLGVWIALALLAWWYTRVLRGPGEPVEPPRRTRLRRLSFGSALFLLWASLDWPLGPLGASYLASVHMVQFLAVGVAAPPLLLLGVPPRAYEGLRKSPRLMSALDAATHPVGAFFVFNIVMTVSHWPGVVDTLMPTQLGSFVLDAAWLAAGLIFWWPLIAPVPEWQMHPLAKIAYLALNAFLIRPPFAMLIFSESPIYAIYELAPPPGGDALNDQQFAGAVMKIGLAWIMFVGVLAVFRRWMLREEAAAGAT